MSVRFSLLLLSLIFFLVGCPEQQVDDVPAAKKAECKLVGDWVLNANTADPADKQISASFAFNNAAATDLAKGSMKLGSIEINDAKILSSASDVSAIEGGQATMVTWDYVVGEGNRNSEECKLSFVDDCEAISLECKSRNFKLTRQ